MLYSFLTPIFSTFGGKCLRIGSIFQRNAMRLNGTTSSDNSTTSYRTSPTTPPSPSSSAHKSASDRTFTVGAMGVVPLFIAGLLV